MACTRFRGRPGGLDANGSGLGSRSHEMGDYVEPLLLSVYLTS